MGLVRKGPPRDVVSGAGLEGCMGEEGKEHFGLWESREKWQA